MLVDLEILIHQTLLVKMLKEGNFDYEGLCGYKPNSGNLEKPKFLISDLYELPEFIPSILLNNFINGGEDFGMSNLLTSKGAFM